MRALVCDIGGTKTSLALAELDERGALVLRGPRRYSSAKASGLGPLVERWRVSNEERGAIEVAVLAVAGPVDKGRCQATNLPWEVDARALEAADLGLGQVSLINDLEAQAWSVGGLEGTQLETLHEGEGDGVGNRCVIAAGTGLGEAGLAWDGARHHPFASEGGHADFAPTDARELALFEFLNARHGHVSWERVASGMGIVNLYTFLLAHRGAEPTPELAGVMAAGEDVAAAVAGAAQAESCPVCFETMELFAVLYGREAGNLALTCMARGGVYLSGGVALANLPLLRRGELLRAFFDKGRMEPLLRSMPVRIIVEREAGLLGAARRAFGAVLN